MLLCKVESDLLKRGELLKKFLQKYSKIVRTNTDKNMDCKK